MTVEPELAVNVPATEKVPVVIEVVALEATARLLKASVPELAIDELLFIVIVPPLGDKLPEPPRVNAPPIAKEWEVVVVPLIVKLLKVNVPEEFEIDDPLLNVIVPLVGAKVIAPDMVKAPATEYELLYCD